MSITVGVDPVTFLIARVLTSAVLAGIGAVVALTAGEKIKVPKQSLWVVVGCVACGVGLASFLAGWASVKVSIGVGLAMTILGGSLVSGKGAARVGAAIALLVAGAAWVGWNLYLMFS